MEEKEREEGDGDNNDVVVITAVQLFCMTDEEVLGKEMDNKKKKDKEDKRKGNDDGGVNNSDGGAKRGKKMRVGINIPASKGDNEDAADS